MKRAMTAGLCQCYMINLSLLYRFPRHMPRDKSNVFFNVKVSKFVMTISRYDEDMITNMRRFSHVLFKISLLNEFSQVASTVLLILSSWNYSILHNRFGVWHNILAQCWTHRWKFEMILISGLSNEVDILSRFVSQIHLCQRAVLVQALRMM